LIDITSKAEYITSAVMDEFDRRRLGFLVVTALRQRRQRRYPTSGPVSTEMGDRVRVQFAVRNIYLGMWPATQINSACLSLRG